MEHDPELCADVIAGGIDKYVKQQGRNTVMQNVEHDEALVGYARVAGPDACPFCKTMSSQGFHFKSRATAGMGASHGGAADHFHPYCNCGLAVAFKDRHGTIRAEGLDGMGIEGWDPDELYREYQEVGWSFGHKRKKKDAAHRAKGAKGTSVKPADVDSFSSDLLKSAETLMEKEAESAALVGKMNSLVRRMKRSRSAEKRAAMRAEYDSLKSEYEQVRGHLSAAQEAHAELVRKFVGRRRALGPGDGKSAADFFDFQCTHRVKFLVEDAMPYVPRDWLETMKTAGVKVKTVIGERSYFDIDENALYINPDKDKLTVVHELAHAMDARSQDFFDDSKAYFEKRTKKKTLALLDDLDPGRGYELNEEAYDMGGRCIDPYVFKEYRDSSTGDLYAFEVASMGVEYLYRQPWLFAKDPSHLRFALHKLLEV